MPGLIHESATAKVPLAPGAVQAAPRWALPADAWRGLALFVRRKPLGAVSAAIICALVLVAVLAPVVAPHDPYEFNLNERGLPIRMHAPSAAFPLGTDPLGRDVLSRIVYGARVSLIVGFASVLLGTVVGTGLGLVCGS